MRIRFEFSLAMNRASGAVVAEPDLSENLALSEAEWVEWVPAALIIELRAAHLPLHFY